MRFFPKKALPLLLAAGLGAAALPWAASAAPQEAVPESGSLQAAGRPDLYAIDDFNGVKELVEGGTEYMAKFGVTRAALLRELEAHQSDSFYLGTPYTGGDWQSPNGDISYNGSAGMNCAGFVSYVLRKAGLQSSTAIDVIKRIPGQSNQYGSGRPYDILANASNYLNLVENGSLTAHVFRTKQEFLSSGLAQKGDILLMWYSKYPDPGQDNHIGIYWGDQPGQDLLWHSSDTPQEGNQISAIVPASPNAYYILIPLEKKAEPPAHHPVFVDVPQGAWYYDAVEYVNTQGYFNGTAADTFSPNSPMTRGMFVTVLGKFAAIDPEAYSNSIFTDVPPNAYYAPYVNWAAERGIVNGTSPTTFSPNSTITREQMATIFYKYAKATGADTSVTPDDLLSFPDGLNTSDYAQQGMAWAATHGVLSGSDGKLLPKGTATRAQTAQIVYNACDLLSAQVDTPPANAVWVVDTMGHYITAQKLEQVLIPGTEIGHWEDSYESHTVYMCNQDRMIFETLEELHAHQEENFDWDTMTGTCWSYSLVASDPKPTGEKYWVVDYEGDYEWQWTTEHIWVDEVGHWE